MQMQQDPTVYRAPDRSCHPNQLRAAVLNVIIMVMMVIIINSA